MQEEQPKNTNGKKSKQQEHLITLHNNFAATLQSIISGKWFRT